MGYLLRNPKSEIRNPKQVRMLKTQNSKRDPSGTAFRSFGFRICFEFPERHRATGVRLRRSCRDSDFVLLPSLCDLRFGGRCPRQLRPARRETLRQGNRLYGDKQFAEAVNKYNDVLVEQPQAVEPKFNKANSYYRLDDLSAAMDLYQQVAAESKDMALVAKAKYNLGNCFFQRGTKQRDSDLQKAVEDMQTSIANWRQVLDLDPQNQKAAKNIEVARLTIKDILDQMKKQQQDQQNQKNKQDQQNQQQQQQQNQSQQQNQPKSQKDPNQPQDPNQAKKTLSPSLIPIRPSRSRNLPRNNKISSRRRKPSRTPRPERSLTRSSGRRKNAKCCSREVNIRKSRKTGRMKEGKGQKVKGTSRNEAWQRRRSLPFVLVPFYFFLASGRRQSGGDAGLCEGGRRDGDLSGRGVRLLRRRRRRQAEQDRHLAPGRVQPSPRQQRHLDEHGEQPHDGQPTRRTTRSPQARPA